MLTAGDALHPAVVLVSALERPALEGDDEQLFAVFEPREQGRGPFLGLVSWHDVSRHPRRLFGDQLPRAVTPLAEDAPLPEVLRRLSHEARAALPVLARDGSFRGAVTRTSALHALLARGCAGPDRPFERLVADIQRLEAAALTAQEVAHDLRNVLTGLNGLSHLFRLGAAGPLAVEQLHAIASQARLLTERLDLAAPVLPRHPRRVRLDEALAALVPMLSATVGAEGALRVQLGSSAEVEVDSLDLERVLINLVVNAREVTPPGGSIELSSGVDPLAAGEALQLGLCAGSFAWVVVRDHGPGIDELVRRRIFERGFSTKSAPADQSRGLGLSTAMRLSQRNGGALQCLAAVGRGTRFRLLLPARS